MTTMLSEKKQQKNSLSITGKEKLKIIKMKPGLQVKKLPKKETDYLYPPINQLSTGYLKAKKHDPL